MVMFVQSYRKAGNSTAYYDAVVADGATAYWTLDESSGNFADSIGGHTMTVSDVTYGADALITDGGSAATFDDVNDYATATGHADLYPAAGEDFTMEAWIECDWANQFGPILYMRKATGAKESIAFSVGYVNSVGGFTASKHIGVYIKDTSGNYRSYHTTSDALPNPRAAIHVVGVYDNTNDAIKIYVDGSEEATTLIYSGGSFPDGGASGQALHMGEVVGYYFKGDMDSVAVYDDVALSAAQVSDHYTKGTA